MMLAAAWPLLASVPLGAQQIADARIDREYVLEAAMLGYRGVGGEIDGVRNPVLRAAAGERVRITIVGVEVLPHDIALKAMRIRSAEVVDVGDRASLTFVAEHDDTYYCTIPGHQMAGMVGSFEIIEAGSVLAAGVGAGTAPDAVNVDFEGGSLDEWAVQGEAVGRNVLTTPQVQSISSRARWNSSYPRDTATSPFLRPALPAEPRMVIMGLVTRWGRGPALPGCRAVMPPPPFSSSMSKKPTSTGDEVEEKRRKTRERVRRHRERQRAASASKSGHDAGSERAIERLPEGERDLIDRYLNARRLKLLSSSRSAYESDLAEFSAYLGVKGLLRASYGDIQVYLSERTREEEDDPDDSRPWSLRTAHRKLSSFNQFYRWALREELISGSPAAGQELRRPTKRDPLRLSLADWERMIDHVEDRILLEDDARRRDLYLLDSLILRLMYHLALRVSEAHGLRLSRTYREEGELLIRVRRKGAGIPSYPLAGRVLIAYDRWMSRRAELRIDPVHRDFVCKVQDLLDQRCTRTGPTTDEGEGGIDARIRSRS